MNTIFYAYINACVTNQLNLTYIVEYKLFLIYSVH